MPSLPVKINKTKVKERIIPYLVIRCSGQVVWNKRGEGDIWTGLYDFPLLEQENFPWKENLQQEAVLFPKKYRHLLSHLRILGSFWEIELSSDKFPELAKWCQKEGFDLVDEQQIDALPKPKLIVRYLTDREI